MMTPWPERLQAARRARGHSQEEAARIIGCSASALKKWEQGEREPTGRLYRAMCEKYVAAAARLVPPPMTGEVSISVLAVESGQATVRVSIIDDDGRPVFHFREREMVVGDRLDLHGSEVTAVEGETDGDKVCPGRGNGSA
jgi:transcriptional regulator with XRE-family HTH domain